MSTRLDLALHEIADAAGDATSFGATTGPATVQRLAGRVRRRRAARAATTAAVAAGTVGAVALLGPQLALDVVPAADPHAAPGTCASSVTTLPTDGEDVLDVELGYRNATGASSVHPATGAGLGTWQGGTADLRVAVTQVPAGTTTPSRLRLLVAQDDVVVGTAQEPLAATPTTTAAVLRTRLPDLDPATATDDRPVHGLVPTADVTWEALDGPDGTVRAVQAVALDLAACDGTGPLTAGTYDVWATTVDSQGTVRGSSGPWQVTVAPDTPTVDELPEDFPGRVRLVDGRLVAAHRQGDGWTAEVVTPGDDRVDVAAELLERVATRTDDAGELLGPPFGEPLWGVGVEVPGWSVRIIATQAADGEPSVVYVLTPTP